MPRTAIGVAVVASVMGAARTRAAELLVVSTTPMRNTTAAPVTSCSITPEMATRARVGADLR
jgi:hypothetical protein